MAGTADLVARKIATPVATGGFDMDLMGQRIIPADPGRAEWPMFHHGLANLVQQCLQDGRGQDRPVDLVQGNVEPVESIHLQGSQTQRSLRLPALCMVPAGPQDLPAVPPGTRCAGFPGKAGRHPRHSGGCPTQFTISEHDCLLLGCFGANRYRNTRIWRVLNHHVGEARAVLDFSNVERICVNE